MTLTIDSGILQYIPKGSYYEKKDEQFDKIWKMWFELFNHDRVLFSLSTLLEGTGFSKGMMTHLLLSNPIKKGSGKDLMIPDGLDEDFEKKIIMYNLSKEQTPRALKNLLLLAGKDINSKKVNNSRTRTVILDFLFKDRQPRELDSMAINFKKKMATLVRHALGKYDLHKVLNGDKKTINKFFGRYSVRHALPVIYHLFDKQVKSNIYYPKINAYWEARYAARNGNVDKFKELIKYLPVRTSMGFRNTFKLPIDKEDIYKKSTMGSKEKLQMETAAKKSGVKIKVNYEKQDLYDLWKALYHKVLTKNKDNITKINSAIEKKQQTLPYIDLGETVVIIDASHSMMGNKERPLHPFLTSLCISATLNNIKELIFTGGDNSESVLIPSGSTKLWSGLLKAIELKPKTIVVISDGYENTMQGMFDTVYKHYKKKGYEFNLLHINPVFAATANKGSARRLVSDIKPMPVGNYKYLETEIIFNKMIENTNLVKNLLVNKYQKMIGGV